MSCYLRVELLMHRFYKSRKKPFRHSKVLKSRNPLPIGFRTLRLTVTVAAYFIAANPTYQEKLFSDR